MTKTRPRLSTKIAFWGTPDISAELLTLLSNHKQLEIVVVVTQKDKPRSKRGQKVLPSAVKKIALANEIPVFEWSNLKKNTIEIVEILKKYKVELNVVLAYGKIIPNDVITCVPLHSVNFHASLLPKLRGASPIESALLTGEKFTGWTLQKIVYELDAGDIIFQNQVEIKANDNRFTLYDSLKEILFKDACNWLHSYAVGRGFTGQVKTPTLGYGIPKPQDHDLATFCRKFNVEDYRIDWNKLAIEIYNQFRAFSPKPGCWTYFDGEKVKLLVSLDPVQDYVGDKSVGSIIDVYQASKSEKNLLVVCGDNAIAISHIQLPGKKMTSVHDFLNGFREDIMKLSFY